MQAEQSSVVDLPSFIFLPHFSLTHSPPGSAAVVPRERERERRGSNWVGWVIFICIYYSLRSSPSISCPWWVSLYLNVMYSMG